MSSTLSLLQQYIKRSLIEGVFTALPAKVLNVEEYQSLQIVDVQPCIGRIYDDGVEEDLPIIKKVPILMQGGGGALISVPIAVGDTVLVIFSCRDIDTWKVGDGNPLIAPTNRFHNINDAIAIPGLYTSNNTLSPHSTALEVKYKDSSIKIEESGNITVNSSGTTLVNSSGETTIDGSDIKLGASAAEAVLLGDSFKTIFDAHTHPYTDDGSPSVTGVPVVPLPPTTLSTKVSTE